MAATNYTPIQLYYSTTASAAPAAGNLVSGELAINITDGKLYYKDNGGVVQVIATKGAGTIGGSNTQIQFNDGGALAGNAAMVFNKATNVTTLTTLNLTNALGATYGGTAQSAYAQGDLLYASAVNTLSKLTIGTVNYILTSTGSVPQWVAPTSVTVQTANNLAGGAAGSVPYQSAADTTTFLAIGAANRVMTSTGSAPQWVTSLTGLTGVSSSSMTNTGLTSGRVVYSGASGVQTDSANLTFNGTTLSAGGFSTTGNSTLVKLVTIGDSSFTTGAVLAAATPAKLYIGTGAVTDGTSAGGATNTLGTITAFGQTQVIATNANVTYTNLATLYIAGAPTAGTNVTITNPYSLYVAGGASYFGGAVTYGAGLTLGGNLLFSPDATYDIGASLANRPRNLYLSSAVNAGAGQFTLLTASNSMYFTAATSSDIAGTIYTVPTIQNWSVGAVGSDFQFYPSNVFTGTPTLTLKTNKQVIVGESNTTAAGGASIRLVVTGAGGGGIQMYGNASGGSAMVPVAGGGMQFYSYTGAQGSESYVQRGVYNTSGNWALGGINPSTSPSIVSNIGVATYGGLYSDRGATGGAAQTLFTMSASSGSNFGQITNTGTRWALGYGPSVTTATDVLTWNTSNQVGINAGNPNATLEVSATFADSAIEEIARFSRVGGSSLYGNNRAAAITFWDQNNATLTAAVAGVRLTPSGNYNGSVALYYSNTGGANATSVSQLTRAVVMGSSGAQFSGANGWNIGNGLAVLSPTGSYTSLALQRGQNIYGSIIEFQNASSTLEYLMGTNHSSIGTNNFAFSYGTGPTGVSWSVLSNGTFGAGNINVTNLSGGGNVRFVSNTGVNAGPATSGTTQNAALRLRGGDNACLDMGMNSVNTWIQATDFSGLSNNYYLHLNPNGGVVAVNGDTSTPPITEGLYVLGKTSQTELAQFRGRSSSGSYQTFHNNSIAPLLIGYGGTLSAAATINDAVIRYNGSYNLRISADGTQVSAWNNNGLFNAIYGSYADPSLASSGSRGLQIATSASYNNSSANTIAGVNDRCGVIYVRQNGVQAIPFYSNGGGGIAYQWTALNPQTGAWVTGAGPTINFTDNGSSPNSYSIVFNGGGGGVTIQRTGGSAAYSVYLQLIAIS